MADKRDWFEVEFRWPRGTNFTWLGPAVSARDAYDAAREEPTYRDLMREQEDWCYVMVKPGTRPLKEGGK